MNPVATYFDELSVTWDDVCEPNGKKHLMVALLAGAREGSRVLDVGCGTGIMTQAYLDCGAREVVGIDVSAGMIGKARQKFANDPRVRFACDDAVCYRDTQPFDVVVAYNCYPHFLDKKALVKAVHGLLVPQGRFLVAHGMGRAALNAHHASVPAQVTSDLLSAEEAVQVWGDAFAIDVMVDAPHFYCFGGQRR